MANPQPSDAHLRMAHSINEELMMRDFSKRQRSILDLVLRLSWGCNKHVAIIPLLKNFEICGVPPTKIKGELEYLVNALVIFWDLNTNRFWFNKDYEQWKISIVRGYNKEVLRRLIHINIATSQNGNNVPETGSDFPKQEESSQQVMGSDFPKQEVGEGLEPPIPRDEGMSKESIINKVSKDIIVLQPDESEFLTVLENIPGYPFDRVKDLTLYGELGKRYPTINLVEAIKDWAIHKIDKPLDPKKNQNPRSQINTSFKKYVQWGKNLKQSDKQTGSSPGRDYSRVRM